MLYAFHVLLCYVLKKIYRARYELYRKNRYKAWLISPQGEYCYCESRFECDWLHVIGYEHPSEITKQYGVEDGWDKDDCFMHIINLRYSPIKILKERNIPQVNAEVLKRAKKEYKKLWKESKKQWKQWKKMGEMKERSN